jgi:MOSC domain-containing protein YiiM
MKLVSVNVGLPREVAWEGKTVTTGIFKSPVAGRVALRTLNLAGDGQADLSVHGGPDKAVYAYPAEHYDWWRGELPDVDLPWGSFGENLTTTGVLEDVPIGARFLIGSAVLMVTQPRLPCYKLGIKFGRADVIQRFAQSRRIGFYLAVVQEGEVGAGDAIEPLGADGSDVTVADLARVYFQDRTDLETMRRALRVAALPEPWRNRFARLVGQFPEKPAG